MALEFCTDAAIGVHELPASRLTSSLTAADEPRLFVHVIVWTAPATQIAPLAGAVTLIVGFAIVKLALVPVTAVFAVHTARIRASAPKVVGLVTVQLKLPPVAVEFCTEAAICVHVRPEFRVTSSRTVAVGPRLLVQLMVWTLPTAQDAPLAGAVTLIVGLPIVKLPVESRMLVLAVHTARTLAADVVGLVTVQLNEPPVIDEF